MNQVYYVSDGLLSPMGNSSRHAFDFVKKGKTAVALQPAGENGASFWCGTIPEAVDVLTTGKFPGNDLTRLEKWCLSAIDMALEGTGIDAAAADCIFIFSSTKGNINLLNEAPDERIQLLTSAKKITAHYDNRNQPVVISTACISGSAALVMARRLLGKGIYKHAVVIGADQLSEFVYAGFRSFQAIADAPCRPFDRDRAGINLGEAAACIILSAEKKSDIIIAGGAISNDANHLSGPSRTGRELANAITAALQEAGVSAGDIDMISAHGTATVFNDEMEAKALTWAGVAAAPLHSLKSYTGHTLGAAGLMECILARHAMIAGTLIPSLHYENPGVPAEVNVTTKLTNAPVNTVLKTASGFGGCNAALVLKKIH